MVLMAKDKELRLMAKDLTVSAEAARMHAYFHLYSGVAGRFRNFEGWERGRITAQPTIIYDLAGLPLFYDFGVQKGRGSAGFIRIAANKIFGDPVVATQMTPWQWDLKEAQNRLQKLTQTSYRGYTAGKVKLVCYSYPKLALSLDLVSPNREPVTVIMDVADFTVVKKTTREAERQSGQVAYSLLDRIPEEQEKLGPKAWNDIHREVQGLFKKIPTLDPANFSGMPPSDRLAVIDKYLLGEKLIQAVTQRIIDFCCHTGTCQDHECFCLHPQENNVHCTRASSQMVLCFWRYCCSQHDVAQAFGVTDTQLTPWGSIAGGLNSLTHNCFTANLNYSVTWAACTDEISNRRPFLSDTGGHTRACAGTKHWNFWIAGQPQPRYLYIFDPWPPNTGAIYWENFNTGSYAWLGTLVRKTTNHP